MLSYSSRLLHIFLCHSSTDKPAVRNLYQRLQDDNFSPWLDEEDLDAGQEWEKEIPKAVRNSDVVLVCLSHDSINKIGFVQKEIKFALDVADEQPEGTIYIIPVKLEECDVPDRLRRWQWVSLYETNGYERLVRALHRRANDIDIRTTEATTTGEEYIEGSIYDEDTNLESDTHMTFPCDLEKGEKINIDLRSGEPVDVMIMDEEDYQEWMDNGEVNLLYKEFLDRNKLHAFFTAPENGKYLVIVRNELSYEVEIQLKIDLTD